MIAEASAWSSLTGTSHPLFSCSIISGVPPTLVASTGVLQAIASSATKQQASLAEFMTNRSSACMIAATSLRDPNMRTRSEMPSSDTV